MMHYKSSSKIMASCDENAFPGYVEVILISCRATYIINERLLCKPLCSMHPKRSVYVVSITPLTMIDMSQASMLLCQKPLPTMAASKKQAPQKPTTPAAAAVATADAAAVAAASTDALTPHKSVNTPHFAVVQMS